MVLKLLLRRRPRPVAVAAGDPHALWGAPDGFSMAPEPAPCDSEPPTEPLIAPAPLPGRLDVVPAAPIWLLATPLGPGPVIKCMEPREVKVLSLHLTLVAG